MDGRIGLTGVLLYRVKIPMLKLFLVTEKKSCGLAVRTLYCFLNYKRSAL